MKHMRIRKDLIVNIAHHSNR